MVVVWSSALFSKDYWKVGWKWILIITGICSAIATPIMFLIHEVSNYIEMLIVFYSTVIGMFIAVAYFGSWIYHFYYNKLVKEHNAGIVIPLLYQCCKCKGEVEDEATRCIHCNAFLASVGIEPATTSS